MSQVLTLKPGVGQSNYSFARFSSIASKFALEYLVCCCFVLLFRAQKPAWLFLLFIGKERIRMSAP